MTAGHFLLLKCEALTLNGLLSELFAPNELKSGEAMSAIFSHYGGLSLLNQK